MPRSPVSIACVSRYPPISVLSMREMRVVVDPLFGGDVRFETRVVKVVLFVGRFDLALASV